jgi:aryl-alcohol dehydrogenase-like predicted oxidoreductase
MRRRSLNVRAIGDLIHQGKPRYPGVSNFRSWRIAEIARLADQHGIGFGMVSRIRSWALEFRLWHAFRP